MAKKVIDRCNGIAKGERIAQRQTYRRVSKQLVRETFNSSHPKRAKKARSASKKLKTVSVRLLRELERNMDVTQKEQYQKELTLMWKIINPKKETLRTKFIASKSHLHHVLPKAKLIRNMNLEIKLG